jgi:ABC-type uncharacterized transport system substrate-binding protein
VASQGHKVPAIYDRRNYAMTGGLVSYGPDLADDQIGISAARILKGEKPGDLQLVQPTKFEELCETVVKQWRVAPSHVAPPISATIDI